MWRTPRGVYLFLSGSGKKGRYQHRHQHRREESRRLQSGARDVETAIPGHYAMIAEQLGSLREYVKSRIKEEPLRRKILKQAAAEAFSHERILSQDEINTIIRQVLNHGTISGRPVGH